MKYAALAAAASAVLFAALAPQANAIERLEATNATGACNGALPGYEGTLRKRPAGIINIGTGPSFVSCSTTQNFFSSNGDHQAQALGVLLSNPTAADVTVNCVMVAGINFAGFSSPMQFPKQFVVPANDSYEGAWTTEDDNGGQPFPASLNVSCNLPGGVEIGTVYWYAPEDGTAPAAVPAA